ncbi:MAG: nucleoside 2-deoxyribosyltransferase [Candidatus Eisenbacteria bacterium]|nr:nucleoside 2-deoxyribosyltransferase [Candidatus Eisenbacteria bacterium]
MAAEGRKIYLSASIRGGRDDQPLYAELISILNRYGRVLTEHVGDEGLDAAGEDGLTDHEIYRRDCDWLEEADWMVVEATTPSLGVGYEIALAEARKIPIIVLFRQDAGRTLSAMISGNDNIKILRYSKMDDLAPRLEAALDRL